MFTVQPISREASHYPPRASLTRRVLDQCSCGVYGITCDGSRIEMSCVARRYVNYEERSVVGCRAEHVPKFIGYVEDAFTSTSHE